jgi:hypothetical protein
MFLDAWARACGTQHDKCPYINETTHQSSTCSSELTACFISIWVRGRDEEQSRNVIGQPLYLLPHPVAAAHGLP